MPTSSLNRAIEPSRSLVAVGQLPDGELEERLKRLAGIERKALVLLLIHLGEFDERRLYADCGQPSLFSYCTQVLGYSEQAAYKRIQAARAARAHPEILQRLAGSELTLTAVVILSPHLREENTRLLLDAARGKRTREIEALAAGLAPRSDSPDCIRALPSPPGAQGMLEMPSGRAGSDPIIAGPEIVAPDSASCSRPREIIEALSERRHLFRFTGSAALLKKYDRARELLGASPSGSPMEAVIEAGLDALLDKRDPERRLARRKARAARRAVPPSASRKIAAALRDFVWHRDEGRCTFAGPDGLRCPSTSRLEIDHIRPYALGGRSDDAANLRLMCRAHNQLLARRIFGAAAAPPRDYPQG